MNHSAIVTVPALWPCPPYQLACPFGTPADVCAAIATGAGGRCSEPEQETAEILNALLANIGTAAPDTPPLYVDIGCNLGLFAAQAAALGASVECYEPTPFLVGAIRRTLHLGQQHVGSRTTGAAARHLHVTHAAVVARLDDPLQPVGASLSFGETFYPCGVGLAAANAWRARHGVAKWSAPTVEIRRLLLGRDVRLLKIDIDSIEGALRSVARKMLSDGETRIDAILVELGDHSGNGLHPRGGNVDDLLQFQQMGYDVYRVNIHVRDHGSHSASCTLTLTLALATALVCTLRLPCALHLCTLLTCVTRALSTVYRFARARSLTGAASTKTAGRAAGGRSGSRSLDCVAYVSLSCCVAG